MPKHMEKTINKSKGRMNKSYDFIVAYEFIEENFKGAIQRPFVGMRTDFSYAEFDSDELNYFMIWPEFLDHEGKVLTDDSSPIPMKGYARMYVVVPEMVEKVHKHIAKPGVVGYFMVGDKQIARVVITETNW